MKKVVFLILITAIATAISAQQAPCVFRKIVANIHFGTGNVTDINADYPYNYQRVASPCPTDGHYTFASSTSDCFRGDWFTLTEDHTPGDADGNMMLVNSSYQTGEFLRTTINGFKPGVEYEFVSYMMNLCRITEKCPYPLLPNITIRVQTTSGKTVMQFETGDVTRQRSVQWTEYQAQFTAPKSETSLELIMINNSPGGCGNDFALDDIAFRECEKVPPPTVTASKKPSAAKTTPAKPTPPKTTPPKTTAPVVKKETPKPAPVKSPPTAGKPVKKETPSPAEKQPKSAQVTTAPANADKPAAPVVKSKSLAFPPPPPKLRTRTNALVKEIEADAGEIRLDLYDNGEIDGDTISVYHNNVLLVANARLTQSALTFRIKIDEASPHHEMVMVAENLGSIPPNTSLMIVTAGTKRYEVFISSTKQKNAKVVFNLRQ